MTGETSLQIAIGVVSAIALATDLRYRRIFNWLTFPTMALGLIASSWLSGLDGLTHSLIGIGLGLLLFVWMYFLKFMGAGDVKLLMAYGALGGATYVIDVAVLSILIGGVIALASLIARGRLADFCGRMQLLLISERPHLDRSLKMPFGVSLAIAAVWTSFASPLAGWGFRPWA